MKAQYAKNAIFSLAQYFLLTLMMLGSIALYFKTRGLEQFGVFASISLLGNLNLFANLGLSQSLIKYVSIQGKSKESDGDISFNFWMMLGLAILLVFSTLGPWANYIFLNILKIPPYYYTEYFPLYQYLAAANLFLLTGQIFNALLDAQHKIYLASVVQFVYNVCYFGSLVIGLWLGLEMEFIGALLFSSSVIWFILMVFFAFKSYGGLPLLAAYSGVGYYGKKHLSYGAKIYLSSLLNFGYEPFTRLLIAKFFGMNAVGVFELALKVRGQLWGVIYRLLYPLFPIFSQELDKLRLQGLLSKSQRLIFFFLLPIIGIIIAALPSLLSLLGKEFTTVANNSIAIITLGYLLFSATVIPTAFYMNARDQPEVMVYAQLANFSINLLVILGLKSFIGFYAIPFASALSIFGSFLLLIYFQHKSVGFKPFHSWVDIAKWLLLLGIMAIPVAINQFIADKIIALAIGLTMPFGIWWIGLKLLKIFSYKDLQSVLPEKLAVMAFRIIGSGKRQASFSTLYVQGTNDDK